MGGEWVRLNRVDSDCGLGVRVVGGGSHRLRLIAWALLLRYSGSGGEPPGHEHQGDSDESKQIVENQ